MSDFRPKIVKNAVEIAKLELTAPCPPAPGKRSRLIWKLTTAKNGMNPKIVVYTNDPNEANERHRGQITANLDLPVFYTVLQMLYKLADTPEDVAIEPIVLQNSNYTFPGGKRSAEPSLVTELRIGRDKTGVCWISIIDATNSNRPKIKFEFMPTGFHKFVNRAGEELPKGVVSSAMVKGQIRILEQMLVHVSAMSYDPNYDPKAEQSQGGNGGGFRNQGGYQSKQNDSSSKGDFDEDF